MGASQPLRSSLWRRHLLEASSSVKASSNIVLGIREPFDAMRQKAASEECFDIGRLLSAFACAETVLLLTSPFS